MYGFAKSTAAGQEGWDHPGMNRVSLLDLGINRGGGGDPSLCSGFRLRNPLKSGSPWDESRKSFVFLVEEGRG